MFDLHSHTTASDGTCSPDELVMMAYERGIRTFAITDHDTLAGFLAINQEILPSDFRLIAGVEISASHQISGGFGKNPQKNKVIHIVALDVKNPIALQEKLSVIQGSRANRGQAIVQKLSEFFPEVGFESLWQAVLAKAGGKKEAVGRAHIGQVLSEFGLVKTVQDAFDKYLADDKPAYVALQTLDLAQTIDLIHDCGGLAVLAHPTRYGLSATRVRRLIADFAGCGGDGCELPNTEPLSTRQMIDREIAKHHLLVSVGSDFHGTNMPWRKLGQVASPNEDQVGVWTRFEAKK